MAAFNGRSPVLWKAETALTAACRTLLDSSPGTIDAFISLIPLDQAEGEPEAWRAAAEMLAARHQLDVEFSKTSTHMRVRFSRYNGANGA